MINADIQKQEFAGRLKRIEKGGPNTMGHVYVGPAEDAGGGDIVDKPHFGIFATIAALLLGALAYGLGNLGQFHFLSVDGAYLPERLGESGAMVAATFGDLVIAALAVLILLRLFRLRGFGPVLVGAIGIFGMMGVQSYAIQAMPEVYAALYSDAYINEYISQPGAFPAF